MDVEIVDDPFPEIETVDLTKGKAEKEMKVDDLDVMRKKAKVDEKCEETFKWFSDPKVQEKSELVMVANFTDIFLMAIESDSEGKKTGTIVVRQFFN